MVFIVITVGTFLVGLGDAVCAGGRVGGVKGGQKGCEELSRDCGRLIIVAESDQRWRN